MVISAINNQRRALESPGLNLEPTSGGAIQNTGCGDDAAIIVRETADGIVANASTINSAHLEDGWINIKGCSSIGLYIKFFKGSLTDASIQPQVSSDKILKDNIGLWNTTAGSGAMGLLPLSFGPFTADISLITVIPNPCMNWLRFLTTSTGTTTNSTFTIMVTRGFNMPMVFPNAL